jgi:hypothetical protein
MRLSAPEFQRKGAKDKFGICTETDSSRFHARRRGAPDF